MPNNILPLGALTNWISETNPTHCEEHTAEWLYDHNSLTKKLESQCSTFSVEVKQQVSIRPNSLLSEYFQHEDKILVREVYLFCDGTPVVFAQTEMPYSSLSDQQAQLADIGEQSLGKVLFQDPTMLRGQIEVTEFNNGSIFHQMATNLQQATTSPLWARRSLFYVNNKPLLVSELFLPASGIYCRNT